MKEVKRDQVIEAARKLFHQFGFKKVSMDEIAKEAGVTKKTIYMYFESKEELLKYFIQEEISNMEKIVEKVEEKPQDFFETVNEAIYEILQYRKHQDFLNIIAREAEWLKNPIIIDSLSMIDGKIQNYIKSKLQKAKEKGYIDYLDLDITTFLIYKMYIALIFEWNTEEKEIDEQMLAQTISGILKNGLRKEELSRLFDKIVVFDKEEITEDIKQEYNLTDEMYKELYENGGLAFHLKFMYPQTITNRRL